MITTLTGPVSAAGERMSGASPQGDSTFRLFMDNAAVGVALVDGSTTALVEFNDHFLRLLGYTRAELCRRTLWDVIPREDWAAQRAWLDQTTAGASTGLSREERYVRKDGTVFWARNRGAVIRGPTGEPECYVAIIDDLTEHRRAAEALVESESRHRELFASMGQGVVYQDARGQVVDANAAAQRILGLSLDQMCGRTLIDPEWRTVHEDGSPFPGEDHPAMVALRTGREVDAVMMGVFNPAENRYRWLLVHARPQFRAGEALPNRVFTTFTDLTDLREAEQRRRHEVERNRALTERAHEMVVVLDETGRITYANPAVEQVLGHNEQSVLGHAFAEYVHPGDLDDARTLFSRLLEEPAVEVTRPLRVSHGDGSWRHVEGIGRNLLTHPAVGGLVVNVRDVTARCHAEDMLQQSHKMEAIGRLAGGVAHDFNNVLSAIAGYAQLVADELPAGSPVRDDLAEIEAAVTRGAALTRQLLAFSRQQVLQPRPLGLNEVVTGLERMLRRLIGEDVALGLDLAHGLPEVVADPGQLEQVVMNLVVNARDALVEGGSITVATERLGPGEVPERVRTTSSEAFVSLSVTDTGTGIPPEVLPRIFEPFFTTKEQGKGTGLGLATVYGIAEQSGGCISVRSAPGEGSTFTLYLPALSTSASPAAESPASPTTPGNSSPSVIVLMEDDAGIRTSTRRLLERGGYRVREIEPDAGALHRALEEPGPIHLLLTDVVMPCISGPDVARLVQTSHPETRVLFMSGYPDATVAQRVLLDPGTPYLQKPFSRDQLMTAVQRALAA